MVFRLIKTFRQYKLYIYRRFIAKVRFTTENDPIKVLFSDKDYVVIDKDFGVAVQKSSSHGGYVHLPDQLNKSGFDSLIHCHRLDAVTSGCLLLAKNPSALLIAREMFRKRRTLKFYIAIVRGHLEEAVRIDRPMGQNPSDSRLQSCSEDAIAVKSATTFVQPLSIGQYKREPATKVLVRIITGRTHQIRVHMADLGHNVVGDFIYSKMTDFKAPRVMLHS